MLPARARISQAPMIVGQAQLQRGLELAYDEGGLMLLRDRR